MKASKVRIYCFLWVIPLLLMVWLVGCEGEAGESGANLVGSDPQPPVLELILPLADQPIYRSPILEFKVIEQDSISAVRFYLNGLERGSDMFTFLRGDVHHLQYRWDSNTLTIGWHTVQLEAADRSGKRGLSPLLAVEKRSPESSRIYSFGYYTTLRNYREWTLPDRTGRNITGYAVRVTLGDSCRVEWMDLNVPRDELFGTVVPYVQMWSATAGLPSDSLGAAPMDTLFAPGQAYLYALNLDFTDEFFALVTLPEGAAEGDTLVLLSDEGAWDNRHSYHRRGDEWQLFKDDSTNVHYNLKFDLTVRFKLPE